MKPVVSAFPEDVQTVAILNRAIIKNDTCTLYNFGRGNLPCDTTLNDFELSSYCIDGLTSFLEDEAYFDKVINYLDNDNLNNLPEEPMIMYKSSDLFDGTKADALIILDFLQFENNVSVFFDATYRTGAALSWSIIYSGNTPSAIYNQIDTLYFNKSQYMDIKSKNQNKKLIYQDAARYLGKRFGTKTIPSWSYDERGYYHSLNTEMQKAEKYAEKYEWLKAGEIWNKQSNNKNQKIAAKACYNMALACEMEGKYQLAMDWLAHSNNILAKNFEQHRFNCNEYMKFLHLRMYEVKRLEKQIRN